MNSTLDEIFAAVNGLLPEASVGPASRDRPPQLPPTRRPSPHPTRGASARARDRVARAAGTRFLLEFVPEFQHEPGSCWTVGRVRTERGRHAGPFVETRGLRAPRSASPVSVPGKPGILTGHSDLGGGRRSRTSVHSDCVHSDSVHSDSVHSDSTPVRGPGSHPPIKGWVREAGLGAGSEAGRQRSPRRREHHDGGTPSACKVCRNAGCSMPPDSAWARRHDGDGPTACC
jgi:hypothetical protein